MIEEEGSFAAGGGVIAKSEKYDASNPSADGESARFAMARKWRDTVNKQTE